MMWNNKGYDKAALHGDKPTSLKAFMSEDGAAGRRDRLSMDEVFKQGGHAPSVAGGGGRNARSGNDSGGGFSSCEDDGGDYIFENQAHCVSHVPWCFGLSFRLRKHLACTASNKIHYRILLLLLVYIQRSLSCHHNHVCRY